VGALHRPHLSSWPFIRALEIVLASTGLPPLKWSPLRYGSEPFGGRIDGEEEAHG
jgi:hypothetical protein